MNSAQQYQNLYIGSNQFITIPYSYIELLANQIFGDLL